jgi:hypothetical protein
MMMVSLNLEEYVADKLLQASGGLQSVVLQPETRVVVVLQPREWRRAQHCVLAP